MSSALPTETSVLFTNVRIFDSTGADPFDGEVLVRGDRIAAVRPGSGDQPRDGVRVIDGQGKFLIYDMAVPTTCARIGRASGAQGAGPAVRRIARSASATLHAWALQPRGVNGGSAS